MRPLLHALSLHANPEVAGATLTMPAREPERSRPRNGETPDAWRIRGIAKSRDAYSAGEKRAGMQRFKSCAGAPVCGSGFTWPLGTIRAPLPDS